MDDNPYDPRVLSRRHYRETLWLRDTLESVASARRGVRNDQDTGGYVLRSVGMDQPHPHGLYLDHVEDQGVEFFEMACMYSESSGLLHCLSAGQSMQPSLSLSSPRCTAVWDGDRDRRRA